MEDETLNNVLNLLQNVSGNNSSNNNTNSNNDLQNLLIKFLLSGGLNQIMNLRNQEKQHSEPEPEKPRTIDLTNYQRLDWTTMTSSTTSISAKWICSVIICSEILSSICVWIKRRIGRTP